MSKVYIVHGKPVISMIAMLKIIEAHPDYRVEFVERNRERCRCRFYLCHLLMGEYSVTIEQARKIKGNGSKLGVRMLDQYPIQVLAALCLRKGCERFLPALELGVGGGR